jgi:aminopeptidase N
MLRRLVGDDVFFRGLRDFYAASRFQKVGSEDLRIAMEAQAGRPLERFFERWIYGSTLPHLSFTYRVAPSASGQDAVLRFEQTGETFDVPVTVTLHYVNRKSVDVVVPVTEQVVEMRVALEGALRSAEISKDDGTLAEIATTRAESAR